MADLGWIGQAVSGIGNIYAVAKGGQIQHDTLNKQSEINDRTFAQQSYLLDQGTKATEKIILYVAGALIALMIAYTFFKKPG